MMNLEKLIFVFFFLLPIIPPLAYILLLVAFIIWFKKGWQFDSNKYLNPTHPNLYILTLILAALLSAVFSSHRVWSLGNFLLFLVFPLTYFLFYENIKGLDRRRILLSILFSGLVFSLLGLLQKTGFGFEYHSKFLDVYFRDDGGIRSTLGHPNRVAQYLVLITPLVLISTLAGKSREKWSLLPFLTLVVPTTILTTSVGGILSLSLVLILLLLVRRRVLGLALLFLILIIGMVKFDSVKGLIERYSAMEQRLYTWRYICPQIFLKHSLTGIGIGTYAKISPSYGDPEQILTTGLHNLYLRILIELGLLGFIPFLLFLFTLFRRVILYVKNYSFYDKDGLVAGCGFAILGLLFHAMVGDIIDFFPIGLLFWSVAGMAVGLTE